MCSGGVQETDVPLGKTDGDIDREVKTLLESDTYRLSACAEYLKKVDKNLFYIEKCFD